MYKSEVYGKGGSYAKVVAASVANDIPIYTIETRAPKFIDAEFEKHRMLSSNSSSSRAIPFKQLDEIYLPFDLRQNQKGMQGSSSLSTEKSRMFTNNLSNLYYVVSDHLRGWSGSVHKQHLNRYIEPWMFQKKVVTATEWDNFFKLRLHPDAQPEMQELARCMKEAIDKVIPDNLGYNQWHLPYIKPEERAQYGLTVLRDMSAGRCARVSYDNIHSDKDPEQLARQLMEDGHMTPFEHQATPMEFTKDTRWCKFPYDNIDRGVTHLDRRGNYWSANFRGWIQFRQLL